MTTTTTEAVEVYTTLDLHLQRLALDAVRDGLGNVDKLLSRRKRKGRAEAALLAVDPKTGEILAMVGGRFYNQSQYNRAVASRRQPGSVFKPFVYLAAFEQAADDGATDVSPAAIVDDSPTTWEIDEGCGTPENYENEYDGPITWRRALARSRNLATIKVAEQTGFDKVAALWKKLGVGTHAPGVSVDRARCVRGHAARNRDRVHVFPNMGTLRPLQRAASRRARREGPDRSRPRSRRPIARPADHLSRHEHDAQRPERRHRCRRARPGFTLDAAGKTGTTNDLRDAWFAGFTPELLTVVWVGFDDNQPVGTLRLAGRPADLVAVHDPGARRPTRASRSSRPRASASSTSTPRRGKLPGPWCARTSSPRRSCRAPSRPRSATCTGF